MSRLNLPSKLSLAPMLERDGATFRNRTGGRADGIGKPAIPSDMLCTVRVDSRMAKVLT